MALKTPQQYLDNLRKMDINLYMFGEKVKNYVDNPIIRPSINALAMTYKLALDSEYEDLMTTTSSLTGNKINRFTHLHQSQDDLVKKVRCRDCLGKKPAPVSSVVLAWMLLMPYSAQLSKSMKNTVQSIINVSGIT